MTPPPQETDTDDDNEAQSAPVTTNTPPAIDPDTQTYNTSNGPTGGDPEEFEELTGVSSDWAPHESDNEDTGGGSVDAGTLAGGGLLGLLRFGIAAAGTGLSAAGAGALTAAGIVGGTALAVASMFNIKPLGEGSDVVPKTTGDTKTYGIDNPRGLDVEFSIHPSDSNTTVSVNGRHTDIQVEPVYSPNGEIESFRPVTTADSDQLEELTGVSVMSSEEADQTVPAQEVSGVDDNYEDNGDGLPIRDSSGKVHGVLPTPEQLRDYDTEELEDFQEELQASVEERISKNEELGPDKAHGERQAAEQDLINSIDTIISNRGN